MTSLFALLICHCTTDPIVINPEQLGDYYLRSIISPNLSQQSVVVGRTVPENMPKDVSGAKVVLKSNEKSILLPEIEPGIYRDIYAELEVLPENRYTVLVTLPNGHQMMATTAVPGEFHLITSVSKDTLKYYLRFTSHSFPEETKRPVVLWNRSEHALSYKLTLLDINDSRYLTQSFTIDTTTTLPPLSHAYLLSPNDTTILSKNFRVLLKITALDSSYLPNGNLFTSEESERINELRHKLGLSFGQNENVSGGKGFFASYYSVTDTVIICFIKEKKLN